MNLKFINGRMKGFFTTSFFFLFLSLHSFGQSPSVSVTGRVTYAGDRSPLPGVSIVVEGQTNGTITDDRGNQCLIVSSTILKMRL